MSNTAMPSVSFVYFDVERAVQQVGDAAALRTMLPMLQELLERDVPEIAQRLQAGDVRAANSLLHSLKGCMPIFCIASLCEHLAQVEFMSKSGSAADVLPAFELVKPKLNALLAEVVSFQNT